MQNTHLSVYFIRLLPICVCRFQSFSPLQHHLYTPNFTVLFLTISWRFLPRGFFIYHSRWFIEHFIPKSKFFSSFSGCWQYFLNYKVIKVDIQNPFSKNLYLLYVNKMKQEFWTWLYPMFRLNFWKSKQICAFLIR